jgi:hypothetical protein
VIFIAGAGGNCEAGVLGGWNFQTSREKNNGGFHKMVQQISSITEMRFSAIS